MNRGLVECLDHCGSFWNASSARKDWVQRSVTVSSNCGWNTLTRKSSRNEVSVLMAISESGGTISVKRCKKDKEGGNRRLTLNTLGSVRSLWPTTGPSVAALLLLLPKSERLRDFDTKPGTDALRIWSRSPCSVARLAAVLSISANLKTRCPKISDASGSGMG